MAILVTGATGNLGACLVKKLKERYEIFCLVRNVKERRHNTELGGITKERIFDSDITLPFCGLSVLEVDFLLKQNIKKFLHCAALIKFDDYLKEEIWKVNYQGTVHAVQLAKIIGAKEFHYVSTAYADTRRNPYEQSKAEAEQVVKKSGLPFSIYAPSVIVGDSKTGKTNSFDGMYGYFASIYRIAQRLSKSKRAKFKKGPNGWMYLPVYLDCSFSSSINLIPIDWVVDVFSALFDCPARGEKYYLVHPNPPRVQWVIEQVLKILKISGIKYNEFNKRQPKHKDRSLKVIQKGINANVKRYYHYITEEKKFDFSNVKQILGNRYVEPPHITPDLLRKYFKYAIENDFGNNSKK